MARPGSSAALKRRPAAKPDLRGLLNEALTHVLMDEIVRGTSRRIKKADLEAFAKGKDTLSNGEKIILEQVLKNIEGGI